ncbi:MAG: DUF2817 domain-containing protein [Candidatus Saccharimonadales bacterium]
MLQTKELLSRAVEHIKSHKKKALLVVGALMAAMYGLVFFLDEPVSFSYAGTTCTRHLIFLPGIHTAGTESQFSVRYTDELRIGSVSLVSLSTCFVPLTPPKEGITKVQLAPLGGLFARKTFTITIPAAPQPSFANIRGAVPVSKTLVLELSTPDVIYRYKLRANNKTADCASVTHEVRCDVQNLELAQGKEYTFTVRREFNGEGNVAVSKRLTTLRAATVIKSSVTNKQTIYDRPKSFEVTLDKPIETATVTLKSGNQRIPITVSIEGSILTVTIASDLERSKEFELVLEKVEAEDGSTLGAPHKILFAVSGGPKVTSISIGKSGVGLSQAIIVQFDQVLSPANDIAKIIKLIGGAYTVSHKDNQAIIHLHNVPKCQPFTITVAPGLASAYDIKTTEGWSYASKTTCHTVSIYGYSRRGRPLYAYYFGNGSTTTLYVGAIHGSEPSSKYILEDWVNELEANSWRIPTGNSVVVVPSINPDGVAAGTRNNANNVNLNRNFPTSDWQRDIDDTNGFVKDGGGTEPLSEPESRALASLSQALRPRLTLSYHAVGSMVIGDPGGYSATYATQYASTVGYKDATYAGSSSFDYSITGAFEDWSYQNAGLPSITIELGSYYYRNFPAHSKAFWAMLR